jgi:hypothetical protein
MLGKINSTTKYNRACRILSLSCSISEIQFSTAPLLNPGSPLVVIYVTLRKTRRPRNIDEIFNASAKCTAPMNPQSNESEDAVLLLLMPNLVTNSVLLVPYSLGCDFSCSLSLQQRTLSEISSGARCDRKARTLVTIQLLPLQVYAMKLLIMPCHLNATLSPLTLNRCGAALSATLSGQSNEENSMIH